MKGLNIKKTIEVSGLSNVDVGEVSDGYLTFNKLYQNTAELFAGLCKAYPQTAWKKYWWDEEGKMFSAGINTPDGKYEVPLPVKYWESFPECREIKSSDPRIRKAYAGITVF